MEPPINGPSFLERLTQLLRQFDAPRPREKDFLRKDKPIIFETGDTASALYIVKRGAVAVWQHNHDGVGKDDTFCQRLAGPGDLIAVPRQLNRSAIYTLQAKPLTNTTISLIPYPFTTKIEDLNRKLLELLYEESTKIIEESCERSYLLARTEIRQRTAWTLLKLSEIFGSYPITVTQEDIANIVGSRRETLALTLGYLRGHDNNAEVEDASKQYIDTRYRHIKILKPNGLREIAAGIRK